MAPEVFFYILTAFAFALGAVVGSFLNVVIYRVPAGKSIVHPGSRCSACETPIRWYDNIPILSFFILRGRCRACSVSISPRYALVEALMAFLSAMLWLKVAGPHFWAMIHGWTAGLPEPVADVSLLPWGSMAITFGLYFIFLAMLVVITFVDLDHYLIPHEFTLPTMALGVVAAFVLNSDAVMAPGSLAGFWPPVTLGQSIIGLIAGGLAVVAIFYLYFAARGIEGIGGGDVTLMAVMGAWLGWPALLFIFFASSVQGIIAAGIGALFGADFLKDSREILAEEDPRYATEKPQEESVPEPEEGSEGEELEEGGGGLAIPFGPFIALAGVQFFFFGQFLPPYISMEYLYFGF